MSAAKSAASVMGTAKSAASSTSSMGAAKSAASSTSEMPAISAISATDLTDVPGIGTKKAALLSGLGYPNLASLRGTNADDLYAQAQFHEGRQLDKCVLYAFRCAVAYAEDSHPNPDEYRWWYFCDDGKGGK